jgi:hypothetical protein
MPLGSGRLGLLAVSRASQYEEDSPVTSALYFEQVQACILLQEPARVELAMPEDAVLHEAFIYRCQCSTYDILRERAGLELGSYHAAAGPCGREIDGIALTAKNNPKCGSRWFTPLEHVRNIAPGVSAYLLEVAHHVAFDALVAIIEKARLSRRPIRVYHRVAMQAVDCPVAWSESVYAERPPSYLEAARFVPRGRTQNLAFVPQRGTGVSPTTLPMFSTGDSSNMQLLKLIQPVLYTPADGTFRVHLVALTLAPAATPADRKTRRDTDDVILAADKRQQRITSFFAAPAAKPSGAAPAAAPHFTV